jgi:hypothetical protein
MRNAYRSIQQNTAWWLDTESLEQRWMTQWKLNHFLDLRELLAAAANVVVADIVKRFIFFLRLEKY